VQKLGQNGWVLGLVLLSSSFLSCNNDNAHFSVDTLSTLTSISPSKCRLQTNHQFGNVKHQLRNASVVLVVEKDMIVATVLHALLLHHVQQRENEWSKRMVLPKHLKNFLWVLQWFRPLPRLILTRFFMSFSIWRLLDDNEITTKSSSWRHKFWTQTGCHSKTLYSWIWSSPTDLVFHSS
jgi:hypothetical protein